VTLLRAGSATDVGQVRTVNQDHLLVSEHLWAVADGMGGHQGGEVASATAIDALRSHGTPTSSGNLVTAVHDANAAIRQRAGDDPDLAGMGTTLTVLALVAGTDPGGSNDVLVLANVGDSRTYLLRAESADLEQISEDHSLVATMERQGQLTADEAATHPQRNIITRALGIDPDVLVDTWELRPVAGDRFLLCSDGLSNEVSANRMAAVLRRIADPGEAAAELVRLANAAGGRDNIAVVVVDVAEAATTAAQVGGATRVVAPTDTERPAAPPPPPPPLESAASGEDGRPGDSTGAPEESEPPAARQARRVTWRVVAFLGLLALLVGASIAITGLFARGTYFVGDDGGEVAVLKGKPGGLLWFQPTITERTDLEVVDLPEAAQRRVAEGIQTGTVDEARAVVDNLRTEATPPVTTPRPTTTAQPTTTTTTTPATTTTRPPGPGG